MVLLQEKLIENVGCPVDFIASNTHYLELINGSRKFDMNATYL